jgi:formylglycine-generating enzyme required for sulfatase activity
MKLTIAIVFLYAVVSSEFANSQSKFTNSIGMDFVLIQPGSVLIGDFRPPYPVPDDTVKALPHDYMMWMGEGRRYNAEEFKLAKELALRDSSHGFKHEIKKAYYIATTEVTQGQWKKVMGYNPSKFKMPQVTDSLPVESVSWKDAQKFLRKLNKLEKVNSYRLPTEFEWEYAARAGASLDIPWKDIEVSANLNKTNPLPVGRKKPNAWGLYDVLGNVWEWVEDYYNEKIFADPEPPRNGKQHVLKGASFVGDVKNATYMTHAGGPGNGWDVGFRIVKEIQ